MVFESGHFTQVLLYFNDVNQSPQGQHCLLVYPIKKGLRRIHMGILGMLYEEATRIWLLSKKLS